MTTGDAMFKREELAVDGVKTVVHSAGTGEPVVFLHGAGTIDGFDFMAPWAEKFRVIAPYHPGFGELFDVLKLDTVNLVGLSLGGYLAAKFCSEHGHRVKKLVLIAPAGIIDPQHPILDVLAVPGDQIVGLLASNFEVVKKRLPEKPNLDFIGDRYPETGTLARGLWEHTTHPKLMS